MTSKRFEVDMGLNASEFTRGAKDAEKAVSNLEDALNDVGAGGARDADKIEDALKDVQSQAKRTERAVDDIGDAGGRGLGKVRAGAQEVSQEVGQNLGEAVSSIRGDLSDLGQVGQDTLGGLAATLAGAGPAGIAGAAALAAGAVGLGLVTAELQAQEERAERLRDRLSAAYQDAAQAGRDYLDVSQLIAEANDLIYNPDRADEWKQVQEDAKTLQLDVNTLIKANAGDLTAQSVVQKEINDYLASSAAYSDKNVTGTEQMTKTAVDLRDRWSEVADATRVQADNAERSRQITSEMLLDAASKAGDVAEQIDEVGNKLISLPDGKEFVIDAKTGQATEDVSRFGKDVDGVIDRVNGREVVVKVRRDSSEWDNWEPQLKRGYVDATLTRNGMSLQ